MAWCGLFPLPVIVRIVESTLSALPTDGEMILSPYLTGYRPGLKKMEMGRWRKWEVVSFFNIWTDRKVSQVRIFQSFRDWKQNKNIKSREFQPHQS